VRFLVILFIDQVSSVGVVKVRPIGPAGRSWLGSAMIENSRQLPCRMGTVVVGSKTGVCCRVRIDLGFTYRLTRQVLKTPGGAASLRMGDPRQDDGA
jgi:hypothetical protein